MKKLYEKHFEFGGQMMNYCKKLCENPKVTYISHHYLVWNGKEGGYYVLIWQY